MFDTLCDEVFKIRVFRMVLKWFFLLVGSLGWENICGG